MCENSSVSNSESGISICSEDFDDLWEESTDPTHILSREVEIGSSVSAENPNSLEACEHPGYFAGMCVRCGALKEKEALSEGTVPLRYVHKDLELSGEEALRLSEKQSLEAESRGKLQLVLDLDHTLLHSAPLSFALSFPVLEQWMKIEMDIEKEGIRKRTLYQMPSFSGMTKLRPGVFEFLSLLSPLYDMHIYTMGEEQYAQAMAQLLDPSGELFNGKIISRHHSSTPMMKSLDVVIGADRMTLIVDDTWQVWQQHADNLIRISKYLFFPPSPLEGIAPPPPETTQPPPSSLSSVLIEQKCWLELLADECPRTNHLHRIRELLERVHREYFASDNDQRDVRRILKSLQTQKRRRG